MKRTIIVLYIVVVAVMAAATVVESVQGTEYASEHFYGSWWFSCLWALLTVAGITYLVRRKVRRPSVVVLHLAFVVILAGALLTHLTSVQGVVPLRQGVPTNQYLTRDLYLHNLPFTIVLDRFELQFYEGTSMPSDFISHVTIDSEPYTISMNNILSRQGVRLYQSDFDPDLRGSILALNSDPWGIPITYCGYTLLFISLIWMLIDPKGGFRRQIAELRQHHFPLKVFVTVLLAVFGLLVILFLRRYAPSNHPMPVLNSRLLPIHVSTIMMAYILLLIIFISNLTAVIVPRWREGVRRLSQFLLYPSLTLLGFGIFIGAIWANRSWGNYWSWDPKETWALITFMIYAVPAHKSFHHFSAKHKSSLAYHLYMSMAFFTIVITYFGVNHLLGGMHSYG